MHGSDKNSTDNADYKSGYDSGRSDNTIDQTIHELGRMAEAALCIPENDVKQAGYEAGVKDAEEFGRK